MRLLPRGARAEEADLGFLSNSVRAARFAVAKTLDEQDMRDGAEIGLTLAIFDELGRSAASLRPDLVYSTLLDGNTLAGDGVALFHADHGNLATGGGSALASDTLDTAMAAVEAQTLADDQGDALPAGVPARYLLVPPALHGNARRLVRNMALGDGADLIVRSEPRVSVGVVDPVTDELVAGSATAWYVAGPEEVRPCILLAALDCKTEPTIRTSELSQGRWGAQFDVHLDLGCVALDWRPLYKAAGA